MLRLINTEWVRRYLQFTTARTGSSQSAVSSPVFSALCSHSQLTSCSCDCRLEIRLWTRRLATISHQHPTLIHWISTRRVPRNCDCSSLYRLGTNCRENTVSLLLFHCCLAHSAENTILPLQFEGRCLAMSVVSLFRGRCLATVCHNKYPYFLVYIYKYS
jgi:hypothetical protein